MKILVAFKIVPDDQDIKATPAGELDFSKAKPTVSSYDTNAMEAAVQLAAASGAEVVGITVGPAYINESKVKKNALSRGLDRLVMVAGDEYADMDAHATASALANAIQKENEWDLVLCGDGSADNYAQQVDVQLAAILGTPSASGVTSLSLTDVKLVCERALEDVRETIEIPLPAVVAVAPAAAEPRIPSMKEILAAGKKPMDVTAPDAAVAPAIEVVSVKAPEQMNRACDVVDAAAEGAIDKVAAAIKAAL